MTEADRAGGRESGPPGIPGHRCGIIRKISPIAVFRRLSDERDERSRSVPSLPPRPGSSPSWGRKMTWAEAKAEGLAWAGDPYNLALLLWTTCVALSGAVLFLVMTGTLDSALPRKRQREAWFEASNQILNALFTLMALYHHPRRAHHLALLLRWAPADIARLRPLYCRGGTYRPHEWAHLTALLLLLNLNCFSQYALCALNLALPRPRRPPSAVALCLSAALASAAAAGLYSLLSPLGRDYGPAGPRPGPAPERRLSFAAPTVGWRGRLSDLRDDVSVAYLSLFCTFCLFGWNMERLGFGNMYVHVLTFVLFCTAPFWVLNLAAVNVADGPAREALGVSGIVLCLFGLLYGGFWRVQMRKRFRIGEGREGAGFFVGGAGLRDCAAWLCCCWCALSQEVRTADFYSIVEDGFAVAGRPPAAPPPDEVPPVPPRALEMVR